MAPEIIDLVSSDEDEPVSPSKAARNALSEFQARPQKVESQDARKGNGQQKRHVNERITQAGDGAQTASMGNGWGTTEESGHPVQDKRDEDDPRELAEMDKEAWKTLRARLRAIAKEIIRKKLKKSKVLDGAGKAVAGGNGGEATGVSVGDDGKGAGAGFDVQSPGTHSGGVDVEPVPSLATVYGVPEHSHAISSETVMGDTVAGAGTGRRNAARRDRFDALEGSRGSASPLRSPQASRIETIRAHQGIRGSRHASRATSLRPTEDVPDSRGNFSKHASEPRPSSASSDGESLDEIPARPTSMKRTLSRAMDTEQPRKRKQNMGHSILRDVTNTADEATAPPPTLRGPSACMKAPSKSQIDEARPIGPDSSLTQQTKADSKSTRSGIPYSYEEDLQLKKLKEVDKMSWQDMLSHFEGRTAGSLQVRYSKKLKGRQLCPVPIQRCEEPREQTLPAQLKSKPDSKPRARAKKVAEEHGDLSSNRPQRTRGQKPTTAPGFVTWTKIRGRRHEATPGTTSDVGEHNTPVHASKNKKTVKPPSVASLLRRRELGESVRYGSSKAAVIGLQNRVLGTLGPNKYYTGTSGDVNCTAWSRNGSRFAIGSIAVSDERNMQYNRPRNLLYGNFERGVVEELPEHHVPRPEVAFGSNPNGLHAMKETQDPRLFMTVSNVTFVEDTLYTAGGDSRVRSYDHRGNIRHTIEYGSAVDLLATSHHIVASGCHTGVGNSIVVHNCRGDDSPGLLGSLAPSRLTQAIFPSALRWGSAYQHQYLLLAGFTSDSLEKDNTAGATCLWSLTNSGALEPVEINSAMKNIFDVAWNPQCSPASSAFAIAGMPPHGVSGRWKRSVVQCFAPGQTAKRVIEYECPALDINDLLYCPYDDNLIAAGATDSKVYVWDKRFVNRNQRPLHELCHGTSLNVLDHDRDVEAADTGIRFLSWGSTNSRLYSGSSDGTVKVWDPHRSSENAHIEDVATFSSAVMSGAFSPDFRDLLVGEEHGRVNLLSVGCESRSMRAMSPFDFKLAPAPVAEDPLVAARELYHSDQIRFVPMGDLPKRQAVVSDGYQGPSARTRIANIEAADRGLKEAMESSEHVSPPERAAAKVQGAMERKEAAEQRYQDYLEIEPRALAQQEAFARRENNVVTEQCRLDCNHLPQGVGEPVEDSRRSEQRIPDALRALMAGNYPSVIDYDDPDELIDGGLLFRCAKCSRPAPAAAKGLPHCVECTNKLAGKTAACVKCTAAILPGASTLCERCCFRCFRCSEPARVSLRGTTVICPPCALAWNVGSLGYDIIDEYGMLGRKKMDGLSVPATDNDGALDIGRDARNHYASLWGK